MFTESNNCFLHIQRCDEKVVIRIYSELDMVSVPGGSADLGISNGAIHLSPFLPKLLNNPKTGDVLQISYGGVDATFVCEVALKGIAVDQRLIKFHTQ